MGRFEANIIRASRGRNLPKQIAEAPVLRDGLEFFYTAFFMLTSCRQIGMGEGTIPWTAINAYADRHELDETTRTELEFHIRMMDAEYLKFRQKKVSQQ